MPRIKLLLLVSLFLLVITPFIKNGDSIRYRNLPCHWRMLNTAIASEQAVDFAFFGSSRSLEAVNAEKISRVLHESGYVDTPPLVYDFSRSWRGGGLTYVMLRDLLSSVKVKNIVIEANLTNKLIYHGYWSSIATYTDLLNDIGTRKDIDFLERVQIFFKHTAEKFNGDILAILQNTVPELSKDKIYQKKDCSSRGGRQRPDSREKRKQKNKNWRNNTFKWDLESEHEARNDFYFKSIIKLANDHSVNLIFTYFNVSYSSPLSEEFISTFEQKYKHRLLSVNDTDVLSSMYENGYRDITHMIDSGQEQYASWFVNKIDNLSAP